MGVSHKDFTCILHDLSCILLSITVEYVSTVQHVKIKDKSVNLTAFSYRRLFNINTRLK